MKILVKAELVLPKSRNRFNINLFKIISMV